MKVRSVPASGGAMRIKVSNPMSSARCVRTSTQRSGGPTIASRPYRLETPLPSDAGRVLELLARGSHRRALREYTGALLPHSEAPSLVALRHRLTGLLREAVLTDGSAEAVRAPASTAEVCASLSLKTRPNSMIPTSTSRMRGSTKAASTATAPRSRASAT